MKRIPIEPRDVVHIEAIGHLKTGAEEEGIHGISRPRLYRSRVANEPSGPVARQNEIHVFSPEGSSGDACEKPLHQFQPNEERPCIDNRR
jgi:hypothetical protein